MHNTPPIKNMVHSQLFPNWVHDERILHAMYDVPREAFLPPALQGSAYADEDLQLADGRALIAPLTFARLLELAQIEAHDRVLVVGCLSGYCAAVIAKLSKHVTGIDTDLACISAAQAHFVRLAIGHAELHQVKSLASGYEKNAPYDCIVLCGAYETLPDAIDMQLKEGGRIVGVRHVSSRPGYHKGLGRGVILRAIEGKLQHRDYFDASSALLPGFQHAEDFRF